jgi:hypothetical protein
MQITSKTQLNMEILIPISFIWIRPKRLWRIWFHCNEEEKIDIEFVKLIQLYHFFKQNKTYWYYFKNTSVFESFFIKNLTGNNNLFILIGFEWAIYVLTQKNTF